MNGLAQYGIHRGRVLPPVQIDLKTYPAPAQIWETDLQSKLISWFPKSIAAPTVNQVNLLYFIFPPTETTLLYNNGSGDPIGNGVQGWHTDTKYHSNSLRSDVIWATVKTNDRDHSSASAFVKDLAGYITHELVEAFNDPFNDGRRELGDPCVNSGSWTYFNTWSVQYYFSDWDQTCIQGDLPPMLPRTFQMLAGAQQVFVLGINGDLWLEHAPFGASPSTRTAVATEVMTFQALSASQVFVLDASTRLWLETAPFGRAPAVRTLVADNVQAFQAIDTQTVMVQGLRHAPDGHPNSPTCGHPKFPHPEGVAAAV